MSPIRERKDVNQFGASSSTYVDKNLRAGLSTQQASRKASAQFTSRLERREKERKSIMPEAERHTKNKMTIHI